MIAMTPEDMTRKYPFLYHMAELSSWPSIQRHGLLSTSALLDLYEITGPTRAQIESRWRPARVPLTHPTYGEAFIRDQLPMPEDKLRGCLVDMTTRQWYELINGKTFFWPEETPMGWMLNASPYRGREHAVIVVATRSLLSHHAGSVTLSAINSGSVYPAKATGRSRQRGGNTFQLMDDYTTPWVSEVAVEYSVPNIEDLAIRVEARQARRSPRIIWNRVADQ